MTTLFKETFDIDAEDIGLSIGGEMVACFESAHAEALYMVGDNGVPQLHSVKKLVLDVTDNVTNRAGQRIEIDVERMHINADDALTDALAPIFEAWMDGQGDVSPPED